MLYDIPAIRYYQYSSKSFIRAVWNRFCSFCNSVLDNNLVTSGNTKSQRREQRDGRQILQPFDRENRRPEDGEESSSGNKYAIQEREREYERQKREIKELKQEIENKISKNYASGIVSSLPRLLDVTLNISEGWTVRLIYVDHKKDIFHVEGKAGFTLPIHSHPNIENINLLSGEMELTVDDNHMMMHENTSFTILKNITHHCTPITDCEMVITFKPPISHEI